MVDKEQDDLATASARTLLKLYDAYDKGKAIKLKPVEVAALVNLLKAEIDDLTIAR